MTRPAPIQPKPVQRPPSLETVRLQLAAAQRAMPVMRGTPLDFGDR